MNNRIKGLVVVVIWGIIYEVIPVWVVDYLLDQPNPLYSLGNFLKNIPRLQDIVSGNINSSAALFMTILCFAIIGYGILLFIRDLDRYS